MVHVSHFVAQPRHAHAMSSIPAPLRKLASSNAVYKRQFARNCAEKLRDVEGRLDRGCGKAWFTELEKCEDVPGLARLLLQLQRRCVTLPSGQDDSWLEELTSLPLSTVEEQQAELSRRLMHRVDEVDRAVPPAREPADMLGEVVFKHFKGHGTFLGTIVEYDENTGFRVQVQSSPLNRGTLPLPDHLHRGLGTRDFPAPTDPCPRYSTTTATPRMSRCETCAH